jgi:hypothetical protein
MRVRGLEDVLLFGGGVIPNGDIATLKGMGVAEVFTPGSSLAGICKWLGDALDERDDAAAAWGDFEIFGDTHTRFRAPDHIDAWLVTIINEFPTPALFRRVALEEVGGWQSRLGYEDWALWIALAERGYDGVRIPQVIYRYRIHGGRKWRTGSLRRHDAILADLRTLYPTIYARRNENRALSPVAAPKKAALSAVCAATFLPARARLALVNLIVRPRPVIRAAVGRRRTKLERWAHSLR